MTDLEKLTEVLYNQQERGISEGDWKRCTEYKTSTYPDGTLIKVDEVGVGFAFDSNGRFMGIFNYGG